ncbi:Uncharacterised protein [Mycobacterium tuberculosis]|nr:Uncharacterised protein [Mycobacterium tuberculosis]COZ74437.1 Uncharacterised protein [Mycobacterium tuberculosis]
MAEALTTRSPTLMAVSAAVTPGPTASTVPHTSEPMTNGSSRGYCPERK